MGIIWSRRVGSDPFYLSYEKSFDKIAAQEELIKRRQAIRRKRLNAWVHSLWLLAVGWLATLLCFFGYAQRTGLINEWPVRRSMTVGGGGVGLALLLGLISTLLSKLVTALESRDQGYLKRLAASRTKMLRELKESTHFERTMALLRRYDPEAKPPPTPPAQPGGKNSLAVVAAGRPVLAPSPYTPGQLLARTGNMAGKALASTFDTLAQSVVGDNPELLEVLRRAQHEAERLRQENEMLRQQLAATTGLEVPTPQLLLAPPGPDPSSAFEASFVDPGREQGGSNSEMPPHQPGAPGSGDGTQGVTGGTMRAPSGKVGAGSTEQLPAQAPVSGRDSVSEGDGGGSRNDEAEGVLHQQRSGADAGGAPGAVVVATTQPAAKSSSPSKARRRGKNGGG